MGKLEAQVSKITKLSPKNSKIFVGCDVSPEGYETTVSAVKSNDGVITFIGMKTEAVWLDEAASLGYNEAAPVSREAIEKLLKNRNFNVPTRAQVLYPVEFDGSFIGEFLQEVRK